MLTLADPELWLTLAELAGQPAGPDDTAEWRQRIERTVGLDPRSAIQQLLSKRVAFVGEGAGQSQDAVILCEPPLPLEPLPDAWGAQRLPHSGRPSVYRLRSGLGLATCGSLACFGDARVRNGMFQQSIACIDADGRAGLGASADFRSLCERVPADPTVLLYARLEPGVRLLPPGPRIDASELELRSPASQPTSQPAGPSTTATTGPAASAPAVAPWTLPSPLAGSKHILLAMHRRPGALVFTAVGDGDTVQHSPESPPPPLLAMLPDETLAAWRGGVDFVRLLDDARDLPERNVLRVAIRILERTAGLRELAESMGRDAVAVVGPMTPARRTIDGPPLPAIALMVRLDDEERAERHLQTLSDMVSVYNLLALNNGWKLLGSPRHIEVEGIGAEALDLHSLWADAAWAGWVGDMTLCWTVNDGALTVATDPQWFREVLLAQQRSRASKHEDGLTLGGVQTSNHRDAALMDTAAVDTWNGPAAMAVEVRTALLAALSNRWLQFLEQNQPAMLQESWWHALQTRRGAIRLGVTVRQEGDTQRLLVEQVQPGAPAQGVLLAGDRIIGCNGGRFATSQPADEFRTGIEDRPHGAWIELMIERGASGSTLVRRLRLPFFDGARLLRRISAIGGLARRVLYSDVRSAGGGPVGRLVLEGVRMPTGAASQP